MKGLGGLQDNNRSGFLGVRRKDYACSLRVTGVSYLLSRDPGRLSLSHSVPHSWMLFSYFPSAPSSLYFGFLLLLLLLLFLKLLGLPILCKFCKAVPPLLLWVS